MQPSAASSFLTTVTAATLAMARADGTILTSPVWFRTAGEWLDVVIADGDPKLARLSVDARCVFLAFETAPPFSGLRISGEATLEANGVREARLEIATRYLGAADARRYVEQRTKPGILVRLPLRSARTWDLRAMLPA